MFMMKQFCKELILKMHFLHTKPTCPCLNITARVNVSTFYLINNDTIVVGTPHVMSI